MNDRLHSDEECYVKIQAIRYVMKDLHKSIEDHCTGLDVNYKFDTMNQLIDELCYEFSKKDS